VNEKHKEISKAILKGVLMTGAFAIASTSHVFAAKLIPTILDEIKYGKFRRQKEEQKRKFYNSFYYLRRKGLLKMEYRGKQLHISLTEEGKLIAKKYSIDDLQISKSKKWDRKWRILIFDIEEKYRMRREGLRGKLKEMGLYQLQKSVWVCPYHFEREMDILKNYFGFTKGEMTTIIASEIDGEEKLLTFFNLNSKT